MNALSWQAAGLCLFSGLGLGLFYLGLKVARILLHGGRLCMAVMDFVFCILCAVAAFLCALAMDQGRFRLVQGGLQAFAAWGVVTALDPLVSGIAAWLRKILHKFLWLLGGPWRFLGRKLKKMLPKPSKTAQKRKKPASGRKNRKKPLKSLRKLVYNGDSRKKEAPHGKQSKAHKTV